MADFKETSAPARVQQFLTNISSEGASLTALEKKLLIEKHKQRKLRQKASKLKHRIKTIVEELKAVELEIDNSVINIQKIEENLQYCEI